MNPTTSTEPKVFKKGDRVRRIFGGFGNLNPGDEATVTKVTNWGNLRFEGDSYTYDSNMFELVEPERTLTATAIRKSRIDWKAAVANGSTTVSLEEWRKSPEYHAPVAPELKPGIYAAESYRNSPQNSILWRLKGDGEWQVIVTPYDGEYHAHAASPEQHYSHPSASDKPWWEKVVRLVAE